MKPIRQVTARTAVLRDENIDTDRIIPARFLTTTKRAGLGQYCFRDWRYIADNQENLDFPLNQPDARGAQALIAGRNFGCGSSREHAAWALLDYGFKAVISSALADIFRGNALKNGLLAIVVDENSHNWLLDNPGVSLTIDIESQSLNVPGKFSTSFTLEPFARHCLLEGLDPLTFLLNHQDVIQAWEQTARGAA